MSADLGYWHEQMKAWRTRAEKAEANNVALRAACEKALPILENQSANESAYGMTNGDATEAYNDIRAALAAGGVN